MAKGNAAKKRERKVRDEQEQKPAEQPAAEAMPVDDLGLADAGAQAESEEQEKTPRVLTYEPVDAEQPTGTREIPAAAAEPGADPDEIPFGREDGTHARDDGAPAPSGVTLLEQATGASTDAPMDDEQPAAAPESPGPDWKSQEGGEAFRAYAGQATTAPGEEVHGTESTTGAGVVPPAPSQGTPRPKRATKRELKALATPATYGPGEPPEEPRVESAPEGPRLLELASLRESPTNPRRTFPPSDELVASVRKQGILQPILVRPAPLESGAFEIIAGHRRFRAAKTAKLKQVPALVRSFTDAEVLEAQLTENLQRTDLHPMEEAEGYGALHHQHKKSVDEIAARVGKSRAYVYGRLKLLDLCEPARNLFAADKLNASTALLIARIPDAKLQARAAGEITAAGPDAEPLSFRAAVAHLQANYMLRLADAPFNPKDDLLLPEAGACGPCPKRAANNPDLFGDVQRADVCTDPGCYAKKVAEHWKNAKEKAHAKGWDVMGVAEARKLFSTGALRPDAKWVELGAPCPEDKERRTWRQLMRGTDYAVTIAQDSTGAVRELVDRDTAIACIAAAGVKLKKPAVEPAPEKLTPEEKEEQKRADELKTRTVDAALGALVKSVESAGAQPFVLRSLLLATLHAVPPSPLVLRRRGVETEEGLLKLVEKMNAGKLLALVFELLVTEYTGGGAPFYSDELKALTKAHGVDLRALERETKQAIKAETEKAEADRLFKGKGSPLTAKEEKELAADAAKVVAQADAKEKDALRTIAGACATPHPTRDGVKCGRKAGHAWDCKLGGVSWMGPGSKLGRPKKGKAGQKKKAARARGEAR